MKFINGMVQNMKGKRGILNGYQHNWLGSLKNNLLVYCLNNKALKGYVNSQNTTKLSDKI